MEQGLMRVESRDTALVPLDTQRVIEQVTQIQELMRSVMKSGEHYGVIPGCGDKPTLLKAGAEKLMFTFRLAAEPDVTERDMGNGHREYTVRCTLRSILTGVVVGVGVGSASTMEGKWRFRSENTGRAVPQEYWKTKDSALLGGAQFSARKVGGEWRIMHRVEHDNPADYYNTCLKMAKKRALVDATLTSLAASDIFTQDIEEMKELLHFDEVQAPPPREEKRPATASAPDPAPQPEPDPWDKPAPPSPRGQVGKELGKGIIERITVKDGTKRNGEAYKQIGIKVDGNWYNTFDTGLLPGEPKAYEGCECAFTYDFDKSGKYRNLVSIAIMERVEGSEG